MEVATANYNTVLRQRFNEDMMEVCPIIENKLICFFVNYTVNEDYLKALVGEQSESGFSTILPYNPDSGVPKGLNGNNIYYVYEESVMSVTSRLTKNTKQAKTVIKEKRKEEFKDFQDYLCPDIISVVFSNDETCQIQGLIMTNSIVLSMKDYLSLGDKDIELLAYATEHSKSIHLVSDSKVSKKSFWLLECGFFIK